MEPLREAAKYTKSPLVSSSIFNCHSGYHPDPVGERILTCMGIFLPYIQKALCRTAGFLQHVTPISISAAAGHGSGIKNLKFILWPDFQAVF